MWAKANNENLVQAKCLAHLGDHCLEDLIKTKAVDRCVITLRPIFAKKCMNIRRSFLDCMESLGLPVGLPVLRKSTRAWGGFYRSLVDLMQEYQVPESVALLYVGCTTKVTKFHLIHFWLTRKDFKEQDTKKKVISSFSFSSQNYLFNFLLLLQDAREFCN